VLDARKLQEIADEMRTAQMEARQIEPFTSRIPGFDLPSAYAVGQLIHEMRIAAGAVPIGRKIGFTNFDMWNLYGVREPIWAYMYDQTVAGPEPVPRTCSIGRLAEPKIEPEIVFHFRSAPPADGNIQALLDSIDWVAHGFEIVQSHFPGWRFQAPDTVADWALHGMLLLGEAVPVERLAPDRMSALASFSLALSCNGSVRDTGKGSNVLGSPLLALAHLIKVLANQSVHAPLRANEIVTTGTVTTAQRVQVGENWSTTVEGIALPGLAVEFVP